VVFSSPTGRIPLGCKAGLAVAAAIVAGSWAVQALADTSVPVLVVETGKANPEVAGNRLEKSLREGGCSLPVAFNNDPQNAAMVFRAVTPGEGHSPSLIAVNRDRVFPRPVWVTRRTAGVRSLSELADRDLSIVTGPDPLGAELPLAALARAGVHPERGQLYGAGDYGSALGLLLHNNTHASVAEAGWLEPMREKNDLVVTWAGKPAVQAGWYRGPRWNSAFSSCEQVLAGLKREDDRQQFSVFPGWVFGFLPPGQIQSKEGVQ
jgi:hypothetical protein